MRVRPLLLALALFPTIALAQSSRLTVQVQAGRVQGFLKDGETVVVYQGDGTTDLRIRGSRTILHRSGRELQTFDIRAEEAVVFLDGRPEGGMAARKLPIRGVYARGFVHVEVHTKSQGLVIAESEELYLDFLDERATLREAELRIIPSQTAKKKGLLSSALVVRAARLQAVGANDIIGDDAHVTVCDHGEPHFAVGGDRLRVRGPKPPPIPSAAPALGGLGGMMAAQVGRPRLLSAISLDDGKKKKSERGGSDALSRFGQTPRKLELEGVNVTLLGKTIPVLPFFTWRTDWPVPDVKLGSSSRFGIFAKIGVAYDLFELESEESGSLAFKGEATVEHYQERGTGGGFKLLWTHADRNGTTRGRGFFAADGLRDRADEDRVGTVIRNEGRFWMRGVLSEQILPTVSGVDADTPLRLQLDAELSRISDPGYLLEYSRGTAQQEKEQETYANLRGSRDSVAVRLLSRHRVNDFQDQVERLPEARLDWIKTPIATDGFWGGLYLDAALRGGNLRRRPADDDDGGDSYRAARGDVDVGLEYKNAFGPFQLRGWGSARYTAWSERADSDSDIARFAGRAGWNLTLPLWKRYDTSLGALRHEIIPEIGMRHVYEVTQDPTELLQFDEVERVLPGDEVFLRIRTRLLTDVDRKRSKVIDLAVEAHYTLIDGRFEKGRWTSLTYDMRVRFSRWFSGRARVDHDVDRAELLDLNVQAKIEPLEGLVGTISYLDFQRVGRSLAWGVEWRITQAWGVTGAQQYSLDEKEFLRHSGKLVRYFHRFALEMTFSHDPQQDDTSFSINVLALWSADDDPLAKSRAQSQPF